MKHKKTHSITVHLSEECHAVIGRLADECNLSKSEWLCRLIEDDLRDRYHQAHHAMSILSLLENDEIVASRQTRYNSDKDYPL